MCSITGAQSFWWGGGGGVGGCCIVAQANGKDPIIAYRPMLVQIYEKDQPQQKFLKNKQHSVSFQVV